MDEEPPSAPYYLPNSKSVGSDKGSYGNVAQHRGIQQNYSSVVQPTHNHYQQPPNHNISANYSQVNPNRPFQNEPLYQQQPVYHQHPQQPFPNNSNYPVRGQMQAQPLSAPPLLLPQQWHELAAVANCADLNMQEAVMSEMNRRLFT